MKKDCLFCGKEFIINSSQQKFCCIDHKKEYSKEKKQLNKSERRYTKICNKCGKEFICKAPNRLECDYCRGRKLCEFCGNEFQNTKNKRIKTCSVECDKALRLLRTRETSKRIYGTDYPNQSSPVKQKIQSTFIKRYNGHPSKSKQIMDKRNKTCLEKYGVKYILQIKEIRDRITDTKRRLYGKNLELIIEKSKKTCLERYGICYGILSKNNSVLSNISNENIRIANLLNKEGLFTEFEFRLDRYSYDIHIINTNILLEINPTYTHNSTNYYIIKGKRKKPKNKYYHYNKTKLALENNYICIHKFDWETDKELLDRITYISNKIIKQESPRLHWYDKKTKEHLLDMDFDKNSLIDKGFVEIYDDGIIIN